MLTCHSPIGTHNTENIQRCRLIHSVQVIVDDLDLWLLIDDHRNLKFKSIIIKKKKKKSWTSALSLFQRSFFSSNGSLSPLSLLDRPKLRNLISRSRFLTTSEIFSGKPKRKQTDTHIFSGKSNDGTSFGQNHCFVKVCALISLALYSGFLACLNFCLVAEKAMEMWLVNPIWWLGFYFGLSWGRILTVRVTFFFLLNLFLETLRVSFPRFSQESNKLLGFYFS